MYYKLKNMKITDNIYINWNNPNTEITLGLYQHQTYSAWIPYEDKDKEVDEDNLEFEEITRLVLGFFFFSIIILY